MVAAAAFLLAGRLQASVTLDPPDPVQGGFVVLRADGVAAGGVVAVFGRKFPSFPDPAGGARALVPVPLGTRPGPHALLLKGAGGAERVTLLVRARQAGPVERLRSITLTATIEEELSEASDVVAPALRRVSADPRWGALLRRPVPGRLTDGFGVRRSYRGSPGVHRGCDFAGATGTPVVAVAGGRVLVARRFAAYGGTVVLDHGQTFCTAYLHLRAIFVHEGDAVAEGQVIGEVGSAGLATGPHLHLGAYLAGIPVDPLELLGRGLP